MIAESLLPLAVDVDTLTLLPGNPRKGDVEAVRRSYERFGQRKPVVAKRDGTVIAGNHQLLAARALGWTQIAVVFTDDDDQTAKAFALADNRTSDLGTYDEDALAEMMAEVATDTELFAATGYTLDDLVDPFDEFVVSEDDPSPDAVGSLLEIAQITFGDPTHKVEHGEVWEIDGRHLLIIADVYTEHDVWMPFLQPGRLFLPYPEPMITVTVSERDEVMVMVQPSAFLAGHLLDNHVKAFGKKAAKRLL